MEDEYDAESLVPEFDQEMANTRKTLERVPLDKAGWKPHEKSMTMGRLAQHIAEMVGWTTLPSRVDSFDVSPPGAPSLPASAAAEHDAATSRRV